jgi:hypothetical protein
MIIATSLPLLPALVIKCVKCVHTALIFEVKKNRARARSEYSREGHIAGPEVKSILSRMVLEASVMSVPMMSHVVKSFACYSHRYVKRGGF